MSRLTHPKYLCLVGSMLGLSACQPGDKPAEAPAPLSDEQLSTILRPLALHYDSTADFYVGTRHDTLALSMNGQLYDEDYTKRADLSRMRACFTVPPLVRDTVYPHDAGAFPVKVLRSTGGSVMYWEPELGVIRASIRDEGVLMPRGLRVGMSRAAFFQRFFRRYDPVLKAYNVVELPGAFDWNCTTFTLAAGKLQRVEEIREPD